MVHINEILICYNWKIGQRQRLILEDLFQKLKLVTFSQIMVETFVHYLYEYYARSPKAKLKKSTVSIKKIGKI